MRLRRITQHVKDQNWFALALDFTIVVAGILIAFQISSMAERSGERATFERQMNALKIEMTENLERYENTLSRIEDQFSSLTRMRELLANPDIEASESEIDALLFQSIGVIGVYSKRNSLDTALASDLYTELSTPKLVDAIERWEEKLAQLSRVQQDALQFRNDRLHAYFIENLALGSIFATAGLADGSIAPSRTGNSRIEMSKNRVLDNILAGRQLTTLQDITYTRELAEYAREIIQLIDDRRN